MKTRLKQTVVVIPNEEKLEVTYYCTDTTIKEDEKEKYTKLVIQLHDCHCSTKILKSALSSANDIEHLVQNMVINAKGHLC